MVLNFMATVSVLQVKVCLHILHILSYKIYFFSIRSTLTNLTISETGHKMIWSGEAMVEVISGVWFPTAAFGASWTNGWVESVLVAVQGFAKPWTKLWEGCSVASGKGFFHWVHSRRLGLDDGVRRLGANRFLDCLGMFFFLLITFQLWGNSNNLLIRV